MRANAAMRRLQPRPSQQAESGDLPAALEELVAAGWREGPGGTLLLATTDEFLRRHTHVSPADIGTFEWENNDFAIPDEDLARAVTRFARRLAKGDPVVDEPIDYRPVGDGEEDVLKFLRGMACRGLDFAVKALARAREQRFSAAGALIAVVSTGAAGDVLRHGTTARFTTGRGSPSRNFDMRWFHDLEDSKLQAMAVLTMDDAAQP